MKIQTTYKVQAEWQGASLDIEVWYEDDYIRIRIPVLSPNTFNLKVKDADDFHEALKRVVLEKLSR